MMSFFLCWGVGRERFIWDPQTISMKKSDHHDIDHPDGWIGLFALPSNHNNSIYTPKCESRCVFKNYAS